MGGVGLSLLTTETEVMMITAESSSPRTLFESPFAKPLPCKLRYQACPLILKDSVPRPLLIGTSVSAVMGETFIMGGGAVCFSFGTYWNKGSYHFLEDPFEGTPVLGANPFSPMKPMTTSLHKPWKFQESITQVSTGKASVHNPAFGSIGTGDVFAAVDIPRIRISDATEFDRIMRTATPVILEGLNLGSCTTIWSPEYLKQTIGHDRPVSSNIPVFLTNP